MKSRDTLIRLNRFKVDEARQKVAQIEGMLADLRRREADLDAAVEREQTRTGITDEAHYAYPLYAKAMKERKENLTRSIDGLNAELDGAREVLEEAYRELKKHELLKSGQLKRHRAKAAKDEQAELDEIGLGLHRRA